MEIKTLSNDDVNTIKEEIGNFITRNNSRIKKNASLNIGGSGVDLVLYNFVIPFVVSLTANGLYDYLKGKRLSRLNKKEKEAILNNIIGEKINSSNSLRQEESREIQAVASTLGISDREIDTFLLKLKSSIFKESVKIDSKNI